jgi:RHH-type proline utilization regulon transcriptional repressor/proline dehydrogenase/delta 1-pyrroline-5-carboxylate dehydrogenase
MLASRYRRTATRPTLEYRLTAANASTGLDHRTRALGREIFARLDRTGPPPLSKAWLDDKVMGVTMGHEPLKVQLFRFVDTLPYLIGDPQEIARHLREYLGEAGADLPWWARAGTRLLPNGGLGGRALAAAARVNASGMARKFIAGSNVREAVAAVRRMRSEELAFTIDLLGEATVSEEEADAVQQQYFDLLNGLSATVNSWPEVPKIDRDDRGPIPRVNVSVKLSALYSQFDPIDPVDTARAVAARLRPILSLAKAKGAFVNFDMEQYSFKNTTLRIFQELLTEPEFKDWPDVGIAIQAYLKDTYHDLEQLLVWACDTRKCPVWIRLVKGAYWDYETVVAAQHGWPVPVFTRKAESDANFERCTRLLLGNADWLVPAFGSHNIRSIAHALAVAEELKVPPRRFEFQMLYGMADPIKEAMKSLGTRVRVYTPYGELLPGMAYLVRRLLENTSNDSFLKQGFADGVGEELLLRDPAAIAPPPPRTPTMTATVAPPAAPAFVNESLSDFARAENRQAMADALARVRGQLGRNYPAVVAGKPLDAANWLDSVNPSKSAEVVGRFAASSADDAAKAVAAAKRAFDAWRDTDVTERAALLNRAADVMRKRRWELAAWMVLEVGKPWREADADVAEAIDFCVYYAAEMVRLSQPHRRDVPGEENATFYDARGVAAVIAPWNFPLAILCGMASAALVAGNTVVLKPAEQSAVVGAKLMEVFQEAGFPAGVVNFLPGEGEVVGPALVGSPDVALIAFTGSLKVAIAINEQAAKTPPGQRFVKKVVAEMGGKNAIIVDSDADLDEAVRGVVDSAFGYAGQKCSAGSRAVVHAKIHGQFLKRLIAATKSLSVGDAAEAGSSLGPVIDAEAQQRILKTIEAGKSQATLAYQMDVSAIAVTGFYVGPTIFSEVPADAPIAQDEIFGPVLCVTKAADLDDAIRIANGTQYALTGGVYSRSPANLAAVKRRFRVGNLYVNRKCTGALVDRQPFGGFALSGVGSKAGGPDYLLQFVVPRTVTENTMRRGFAPEAGPND